MIPKAELVIGEYYWGSCRNARIARWNGSKFIYKRWGPFNVDWWWEEINHYEDDNGFDLFYPKQVVNWGTGAIPLEA